MSQVMIEARDLTKTYGPVTAVHKASFEVRKGEVLGFLGPNGAGKTTTMKILTCFIAPSAGTAKVSGCDVFDDPMGVRRSIGYLPENTPLYTDMLAVEYLRWVARMRGLVGEAGAKRIKRVVEQTGLGDVVATEIRALSKGYRQRLGVAQALIHEPPILILDEPLSGLDPNQAVEVRDLIKEIGRERTVILSTHNLAEVQVACNRVLIIAKGKIVADDTPEGLGERAGRRRFLVTLEKTDPKKARDALGQVKGADLVREAGHENGELRFEVIPVKDEDLRAAIFRAAVDAGLVLLGLGMQGQNLEAVFRDLTLGAGDEPKKAKKGARPAAEDEPDGDDEGDEEEDADDEGEEEDADDEGEEEDAGEDEEESAEAGDEGEDDDKESA